MLKKIVDPSEDVITFDELYRRVTIIAIKRHKRDLHSAADDMKVSRRTLSRWIKKFNIDVNKIK